MSLRLIAPLLALAVMVTAAPSAWAENNSAKRGRGGVATHSEGSTANVSAGWDGKTQPGNEPTDSVAGHQGESHQGTEDFDKDQWVRELCAAHGFDPDGDCMVAIFLQTEEPPLSEEETAALAGRVVAELTVPDPGVMVSPQPSDNKWNVLPVGFPLWFYTDQPVPVHTRVSEQGVEVVMTAHRTGIDFDFGVGQTRFCAVANPRPAGNHPLVPSSTCGHAYMEKGDYVITATAQWEVTWAALGQTGTIPLSTTQTMELPIREFASVVVG